MNTLKKSFLLVALLLVLPAFALAYFQPATLTNGVKKVAVYSQEQANALFAKGYTVEKKTGATPGDTTYNRVFRLGGATNGGAIRDISTSSATYTLTDNDICNSASVKFTPLGAATTVTLPATSTGMFGKCLPTIGSFLDINYRSIGTSTVIAAGAGGTLGYTSSTTVAAGKYGILRIFRTASATYNAYLINIPN